MTSMTSLLLPLLARSANCIVDCLVRFRRSPKESDQKKILKERITCIGIYLLLEDRVPCGSSQLSFQVFKSGSNGERAK